jgi:hypothetical protein
MDSCKGNRSSIGAELVQADQMGGSIKEIGHFIVSIAKTLDQKNGTATMAILKSSFVKMVLYLAI